MTRRSHVLAAAAGSTVGLLVGLVYGTVAHDLDLIPRRRK